ncbi:MAG: glutamine-hydrolyzing carbamoyl-phosphate synthase small subunit [Nitrososphaerota archaeon]|nr:glutamine-hydrolyzing carbamoyl-phosphate synthase small subunit [Nitrososphaerota archaeon]
MDGHPEISGSQVSGQKRKATLLLADGSLFVGDAFGAESCAVGEVVFNTGMVGYPESMTDPSYAGQMLCFTFPLIGNYGVPAERDAFGLPLHLESDSIKTSGVMVQEACDLPSHWSSRRSLHDWMASEGVPGISGMDTRALVMKIRERGVMAGALSTDGRDAAELRELLAASRSYGSMSFLREVSVGKHVVYGSSDRTVVLIDCGVKLGIVRNLLERGFRVARVPYFSGYSDVMSYDPAGVVVSNGPGDPALCAEPTACAGRLVDSDVPVLGICLGEQIVAASQGARTFKLKYGHRGQNKPCVDVTTGRGYVTSQNHGYAVDRDSMDGTGLLPWFVNADDGTVEGFYHESRPCIGVQFHPEASPGPYDAGFVFDRFAAMMDSRGEEVAGETIRRMKR